MAKAKRKKRKIKKKSSKLKIWSLIFMYLISLAMIVISILKIIGVDVPYFKGGTISQNVMVLIFALSHLIFTIISNVGVKAVNAIMIINAVVLTFYVTISFKFLLKGCIIGIVLLMFDLFYISTIYENSEKS